MLPDSIPGKPKVHLLFVHVESIQVTQQEEVTSPSLLPGFAQALIQVRGRDPDCRVIWYSDSREHYRQAIREWLNEHSLWRSGDMILLPDFHLDNRHSLTITWKVSMIHKVSAMLGAITLTDHVDAFDQDGWRLQESFNRWNEHYAFDCVFDSVKELRQGFSLE